MISHADGDHVGGNRAIRDVHPEALFLCHELDRRWVESNEALEWLAIGRAFVDDVERVVRDAPDDERDDLRALTERVDRALGPFPEYTNEPAATVRGAAR